MPREVDLLVWSSVLNGMYAIKVTRTAPHCDELTLAEGENVLHREPVDLTFDALLGPGGAR